MKNELVYYIAEHSFLKCTLSSPFKKTQKEKKFVISKLKEKKYGVEIQYGKHNNIINFNNLDELLNYIEPFTLLFKQALIKTQNQNIQLLMNKNMEIKKITKHASNETKTNHKKDYLLKDGEEIAFLIELGVMSKDAKVKANSYKKFKQINRFLELIHDQFKDDARENIHVVDFGCGKGYLTFAMYHYFSTIRGIKTNIQGLDLKEDVIKRCNDIAKKCHYQGLSFSKGFVEDYETTSPIDLIITLHACDTATDEAIYFGLKHNIEHMFFVPCCQHELNSQLKNKSNTAMLKYGIFKERLTSIITDSARSLLIEYSGYKVQCLEFIETEHTAKNILLRCKKIQNNSKREKTLYQNYIDFKTEWNITPYLEKKLNLHN